ncbi:ABC transporter permease [Nocardioides campestrisoli]|uniref:ABC transporter permease n=1 Tax=Nocardioides campestrisoli TaxID=2736757 RepID=UPI0015E76AA7|nr:iron ABC transporter permease [Nocardioides campestrisoli]
MTIVTIAPPSRLDVVRPWLPRLAKLVGLAALGWLLVWPLVILAYGSAHSSPLRQETGWTLGGYQRVFTDSTTYGTLATTLGFAVAVTILATGMAIVLAAISTRLDVPLRWAITPTMVVLVATPTVLYAMAWAVLGAGESGLIGSTLKGVGLDSVASAVETRSMAGMILVTSAKAGALAYLVLIAAFQRRDPSLEEAARIAGSSRLRSFFGIELAVLAPAIIAAGLLTFVKALEAFDIPAVLGLPGGINVYSTHIFSYLRQVGGADYAAASAASLVIVAIMVPLVFYQVRVSQGSRRFAIVSGRTSLQGTLTRPGRLRYPIGCFIALIVTLVFVLPVSQIILAAFRPYVGASDFTMANFERLQSDPRNMEAVVNTFKVVGIGGLLAVALALIVSFAFIRMKSRVGRVIQFASWVPLALPGIVLGLAFVWSFLTTPGASRLYGTSWALIIGLAVATMPIAVRAVEGSLIQVGEHLEEAARISGASHARALLGVTVRLLVPSLVAAWLLVSITMSGILDVPLLLGSSGTQMIASSSYAFYTNGETGAAAALYLVFTVLLITVGGALWLVAQAARVLPSLLRRV